MVVPGLEESCGACQGWLAQYMAQSSDGVSDVTCQFDGCLRSVNAPSVATVLSEMPTGTEPSPWSSVHSSYSGKPQKESHDFRLPDFADHPSKQSNPWYGAAFGEEERCVLEEIKRKYQAASSPWSPRTHGARKPTSNFGALPTPEDDDASADFVPYFSRPTAKTSKQHCKDSKPCDQPASPTESSRKNGRARHNIVEHRYRENLNARIIDLRDRLPALQAQLNDEGFASPGQTKKTPICKATVLIKAVEYIEQLQNQTMELRQQNDMLENLVGRLLAALEGDMVAYDAVMMSAGSDSSMS